jgi:hypothetical protein
LFILKEENNQSYYHYFEVDIKNIRYQTDQSQLILIEEDDFINTGSQKSPNFMSNSFAKKSISSLSNVNTLLKNDKKN